MKTSISIKLFVAFLLVIVPNILFVVVVSRLGQLYLTAREVGWQNEVKNNLLRIHSLHMSQRTQFLILDKLGRQEAYANLRETSARLGERLDTVETLLTEIHKADSISQASSRTAQIISLADSLALCVHGHVANAARNYLRAVDTFATLRLGGVGVPGGRADTLRAAATTASDSLIAAIHHAEQMVDGLTRLRLTDIQERITAAQHLAVAILLGMTVFAVLFAIVLSRTITTPLRRLTEATGRLARGDFAFDASGYPRDEIGDLAAAFASMAKELRQTQEALERSKRLAALGEVVTSVKHAINNPLMIISGNAQILEMSLSDRPEALARVRTIIEESERISEVTRRLQEIRRPVVERYGSDGGAMISLEKSSGAEDHATDGR